MTRDWNLMALYFTAFAAGFIFGSMLVATIMATNFAIYIFCALVSAGYGALALITISETIKMAKKLAYKEQEG